MDIQWFPGHMTKAKRQIQENLKLVDMVLELVDARIPNSSRNPMINSILGSKPRIMILNKSDMADTEASKAWVRHFQKEGTPAVLVNSVNGQGINQIIKEAQELLAPKMAALAKKGLRPRPIRAMIVGIPNVGKSSLINKLAGSGKTKTENRPGVTRGQQWIRVSNEFELLDTPGILWPKFEDPQVGFKLAITGSIKEDLLDLEEIGKKLLKLLLEIDLQGLKNRYKLEEISSNADEALAQIGAKRGCLRQGGVVDNLQVAHIILSEFRNGKLGNYTLDQID